ncbi:hypothetical protein HMPREF3232_01205 [Fannyhessea vaginae]|nr:hypothetical protein HMPREF3232_01205 [Fannyhessea vaginae]
MYGYTGHEMLFLWASLYDSKRFLCHIFVNGKNRSVKVMLKQAN